MAIPERETYYISRVEAILENILGANNVIVPPESLIEELLQCWLNGEPFTETVVTTARNVRALIAIVNGETYDEDPTSEIEALLKAIANGEDPDPAFLPPKSRNGKLLLEIYLEKYAKREIYFIKKGLSRIYYAQNNGQIGTTGSCYYGADSRIATYDPSTYTGVKDSVCNPWIKVPDGLTKIHIKLPTGFQFALRGYNAELTTIYQLAELNASPLNVDATVDVGQSKWLNILVSLTNSTASVSGVNLEDLTAGTSYEFLE